MATGRGVGLRSTGIELDESMEIESAYFIFEAEANNGGAANLQIQIKNSTSATSYATAPGVNARSYLTETVAWSGVAAWQTGQSYQSADVSTLIEALVGDGGLEASDAIAFRISGTGIRQAYSFDSAGDSPQLVINYTDSVIG